MAGKEAAAGGQGNTDTAGAAAAAAAKAEPITGKAGGETVVDDKGAAGAATGGDAAAAAAAAAGKKPDDGAAAAAAKKDDKGDAAGKGKDDKAVVYSLEIPKDAADYLDADDLKTIEQLARTKGWTAEEAQQALEEHADSLAEQSAGFRAATEADPVYGGDALPETQRLARSVIDRYAPAGEKLGAALRRDLAKSGYGNKLSVVSFLARIGKAMAEDDPPAASASAGGKKSAEQVLYGEPAAK